MLKSFLWKLPPGLTSGLFSGLIVLSSLGVSGCFFKFWGNEDEDYSIEPGLWKMVIEGEKQDTSDGEEAPLQSLSRVRLVRVEVKINKAGEETVEVRYAGNDAKLKKRLPPITGVITENTKKKGRLMLDLQGKEEGWDFQMWGEVESPTKIRTGNIVGADPLAGSVKFQGTWSMEKVVQKE